MPAKKKVDGDKLIKMAESGKNQKEIMKAFKFNTAAQFKSYLLDAYMNAGKVPEVKTGRGKAKANTSKEVVVRKTGSAVISKALMHEMGFKEGDKFVVRKTKSGISLKQM